MTIWIILRSLQLQLPLVLGVLCFLSTSFAVAQQNESLVGLWTLEKVAYKKLKINPTSTQENLVDLFKAALYNTLNNKQQLVVEELDLINAKAGELAHLLYQSTIDFQVNRAFYNRSKLLERPTSGEYLLDGKKLFMEWETADKYTYKILKINASELVLKDVDLKVIYYYKTKAD
ncbi:hypothetical protein F0365_02370 [Nonlabens sp. Ci31]|uniref:hypothetical protein n=1 Tax=Nonlabens sp. Ci31 TaxID=2608253 RepID=UPI001462F700|nr:hypothetical protein [Nonlabens sp. Ci31]QJP33334.1 hypothetical protein F0365_02370 [Nonlabens sp. Ci31]